MSNKSGTKSRKIISNILGVVHAIVLFPVFVCGIASLLDVLGLLSEGLVAGPWEKAFFIIAMFAMANMYIADRLGAFGEGMSLQEYKAMRYGTK